MCRAGQLYWGPDYKFFFFWILGFVLTQTHMYHLVRFDTVLVDLFKVRNWASWSEIWGFYSVAVSVPTVLSFCTVCWPRSGGCILGSTNEVATICQGRTEVWTSHGRYLFLTTQKMEGTVLFHGDLTFRTDLGSPTVFSFCSLIETVAMIQYFDRSSPKSIAQSDEVYDLFNERSKYALKARRHLQG